MQTASGPGLRVLYIAAYASAFDRFAVPPLLLAIAASFDVSLVDATAAASVYFLMYGLTQPLWGALSDRFGRVRVVRFTLAAAVVGGLCSAAAPSLAVLVVARACTGAAFSGVVPVSVVYLGETLELRRRTDAFANLVGVNGFAMATATCIAGLAAYTLSWRLAFVLPAALGAVLVPAVGRLPEPRTERPRNALRGIGRVLRKPWAVVVVGFALVEGAVIHGFVTFWPTAVESGGWSPAVAGCVVGAYGLAALVGTRSVGRARDGVGLPRMILIGAAVLALGYLASALSPTLAGVLVACALGGLGYSWLHSAAQTWASEVVPEARAMGIALFAGAMFVGGSIPPSAASPLAEAGRFGPLFAIAASVALVIALLGGALRRRYEATAVGVGTGR